MPPTPEAQMATMIAGMKAATGKPLPDWIKIATKSGKTKHGELVSWLKSEHNITHGYANLIAHNVLKSDSGSKIAAGDDLVSEMFAGDKTDLRPIFDALMQHITTLGNDIEQAPKKGYVSLRRTTQFATLHPSTKTRFDIGLKLKGVAAAGRLEAAGSWNGMVTHRVRVGSIAEVDAELAGWLKDAYEMA